MVPSRARAARVCDRRGVHVARHLYSCMVRGTRPRTQSQESDMPGGDIRPGPCPKCGNPSRLFTPNAQRVPYAIPRKYEAAWQCTRCGHVAFLAPRPDAGQGRDDAR